MPKLNYTNRKSDGPKLGAIVRKDLGKRIKSTTAHKDTSPLELNLQGKALTDDGLREVATGFVEIFSHPSCSDRLHVLNLANNGLTARSLAYLAPVIAAAAVELQDLDLSANDITLATDEDLEHWEQFLEAFKESRCLKRLCLAGNNLGLPKAWESFLKIYLEHFDYNKSLWVDQDGVRRMAIDSNEEEEAIVQGTANLELEASSCESRHPEARGLPAILVISICDTQITDACSLFLSFVLERHHFFQNEVNHCIWSPAAATTTGMAGVVWQPNEGLGLIGGKILKDAQVVPWHPYGDEPNQVIFSRGMHRVPSASPDSRKRLPAGSSLHGRRQSETSNDNLSIFKSPSHLKDGASGELDSLRKKIQRGIIEDMGLKSVELWIAAINLLVYARQFMIRRFPLITDNLSKDWESPIKDSPWTTPDQTPHWSETPVVPNHSKNASYSSKLILDPNTQSSPLPAIAGASSRPVTPQVFRHPSLRRVSVSSDSQRSHLSASNGSSTEFPANLRGAAEQRDPKPEMIGKLPAAAWENIFCHLADPKGVLSLEQRQRVLAWGRDRSTMAMEQETLGKPKSVQIWRVLEAMGCLELE